MAVKHHFSEHRHQIRDFSQVNMRLIAANKTDATEFAASCCRHASRLLARL
ncbi:hypothetical protein EPYR_01575 [Erwinia pyrifoliae DSM 12163]|nr:hypothetical protein EPYR_01575 [Erwinia pyrifoliae DSM 12163]